MTGVRRLAEKVAVVTGAGSGLGAATTQAGYGVRIRAGEADVPVAWDHYRILILQDVTQTPGVSPWRVPQPIGPLR
jgi:NADP-dependent 3-hydroxy acid dehydrogenase YdfG